MKIRTPRQARHRDRPLTHLGGQREATHRRACFQLRSGFGDEEESHRREVEARPTVAAAMAEGEDAGAGSRKAAAPQLPLTQAATAATAAIPRRRRRRRRSCCCGAGPLAAAWWAMAAKAGGREKVA